MINFIFLFLLGAFGTLYFFLGWRASRTVSTDQDYFVANRQLGVWQVSCNLIATQLGGGMLLGTAFAAYTYGIYGMLYCVGMALGFVILGSGIAARLQSFKVTTTAEILELCYHSQNLKKIASALSILTLFGILIAQVVGFKSLLTSLGLGAGYIVVPVWLSIVIYTTLGGLRAITINDMVQLALITLTFSGIFIYLLMTNPGDIIGLFKSQNIFQQQSFTLPMVISTIGMPALFALIEQDLAQRFFASKSASVATRSAWYAALFMVCFSLIPVYIGMQTRIQGYDLQAGANPLLIFLSTQVPPFICALAICAIVAAIISTADALMNGISAHVTHDFELTQLIKVPVLTFSKIITCVVGLSSLASSYYVTPHIIDIMLQSYELSVSCLLVPLLYCYMRKAGSAYAAYGAVLAGLLGFMAGRMWILPLPRELIALVLSFVGYHISQRLSAYIKD